MLSAILFLMLGVRLQMGVSYYVVLVIYFVTWLFKTVWNLVKDDYIMNPVEDMILPDDQTAPDRSIR